MKVLSVLMLLLACVPAKACDFSCTVQKHVQAIEQNDWPVFESTLSSDVLPFILPNGQLTMSATEYREMLKPWLEKGGFSFKARELYRNEGTDLGLVLLDVDYDEADRNGKPYHLDHYLTLVFKKEGAAWKLVLDQNTSYQDKKASTP